MIVFTVAFKSVWQLKLSYDFFDPSSVAFSLKQRTIEELLKQRMESRPATWFPGNDK